MKCRAFHFSMLLLILSFLLPSCSLFKGGESKPRLALFVGVEAGGVWRGSPPATAQRTDTINASGGEITSWGGDVTLIFPAGAVNTDTQISLRVLYGGPLPLENRLWIKGVELSASP